MKKFLIFTFFFYTNFSKATNTNENSSQYFSQNPLSISQSLAQNCTKNSIINLLKTPNPSSLELIIVKKFQELEQSRDNDILAHLAQIYPSQTNKKRSSKSKNTNSIEEILKNYCQQLRALEKILHSHNSSPKNSENNKKLLLLLKNLPENVHRILNEQI